MDTIYIDKEHIEHDDVLAWIDEHWDDASDLDVTHFEPTCGGGRFCICSLWMQGMWSIEDWNGLKTSDFECFGIGWMRKNTGFNNYLYYKNGKLFYITQHC